MGRRLHEGGFTVTRFDKYRQVVREARGTGWALLALILFWSAAGFGLSCAPVTIGYLPRWVWAAVGGSWLLALALVKYLTTRVFRDMELDDEEARHDGR